MASIDIPIKVNLPDNWAEIVAEKLKQDGDYVLVTRCKDCKHFEFDHFESVNGVPLIVAHEICTRWSDGVKTSENGYCFLAKRREVAK